MLSKILNSGYSFVSINFPTFCAVLLTKELLMRSTIYLYSKKSNLHNKSRWSLAWMTLDMLLFEALQLSSESTSSLVRFSILVLLTTLPFNLKVAYYILCHIFT